MTDPNPGTVHTMEEEMRAAGQGVFEERSSAPRTRKTAASSETATKPARKPKAKAKK